MSEHPYRSQQSPERRRLRFLSWLTSRTRSGRTQWRALGDIASTSMLGIDGRMFVRFEAYRTTEGRQGWRRFTVTDSSGHELIHAGSSDAPDSSVLPLALDTLFEAITQVSYTSSTGPRFAASNGWKRDH